MAAGMLRTETEKPDTAADSAEGRKALRDGTAPALSLPDAGKLRKEKIRLRSELSRNEREKKSARIAALLQECEAWRNAKNLLIYVSYGAEVSTTALIDAALCQGKRVFCPKVEGNSMEFYRICSRAELVLGFRGILEPTGERERFECPKRTDGRAEGADSAGDNAGTENMQTLLVAPGTVFDRCGHRIGYGGGYYDRYLGRFTAACRPCCAGLCFSCQLTEEIKPQKHDAAMDFVLFA